MSEYSFNGQTVQVSVPSKHPKSVLYCPEQYGGRAVVPNDLVPWHVPFPGYEKSRNRFTATSVIKARKRGLAHPADIRTISPDDIRSYVPLRFNAEGYPLNPVGRTGFGPETGLLWKYGANFAADPIVTWHSPNFELLYLLVVERTDGGGYALPGGMCNCEELISQTLLRELGEETALKSLNPDDAKLVYCGYVDDWRNGDHSWIETVAAHWHVEPSDTRSWKLRAGSDARTIGRLCLNTTPLSSLYANHGEIVRIALSKLAARDSRLRRAVEESLGAK